MTENTTPPSRPSIEEIKKKHLFACTGTERTAWELGTSDFVVAGLLPARSNGILVGDSGLGKSPLLYTLALCVAAGMPFLDLPTARGDVLILDYENSQGDSEELLQRLRQHLGLDAVPNDLTVWNANDCAPRFGTLGYEATNIIRDWASATETSVKLVIIDPLSGFDPDAEEKNSAATKMLMGLRRINRGVRHHSRPFTSPSQTVARAKRECELG